MHFFRWCVIEASSGPPQKPSEMFGNGMKLRTSFRESLEIFGNWTEILEISSKTSSVISIIYRSKKDDINIYLFFRLLSGGIQQILQSD